MKKQLLLLIVLMLPMLASADDSGQCGDNVTYTYNEATRTLVIAGSGKMKDWSPPWYSYETSIQTIIIESGVTSIGSGAFDGCSDLTSVTIPNSVTSIGHSAFRNCSGLSSITIPNSVTSIDADAFAYCFGLTSVTIPKSVTTIGSMPFFCCSSLNVMTVESGNTYYDSRDECNAIIETNTNSMITGCKTTIIPNSVTVIGRMAFYNCTGLTSITIPNSVTSIGNWAFSGCDGLTSINIPNSVTSIGSHAFYGCSGLKDIISEIKTPFEINENVFSVYSTATLTVPNGTKSAYQSTVEWNKFTNIVESTSESNDDFGKVANVVDLGLSVKWASWNIGASKIGDYGGLYGAGDPTGKKTSTNVSDYYFNDGGSICGTEYDLAHVKWGDLWRMPKWSELEELKTKCTWTNGEVDGVKGSWVKGPNGNSIFLPWAGNRKGTSTFSGKGTYGYYWSGDMGVSLHSYGYKDLDIGSGGVNQTDGAENYWGQSIRPVYGDSNNGSNTSTKRTIHVATAGTLPNLISESEKYTIEELTLTGELNGTDFRLLRDMAGCNYKGEETAGKLTVLDVSGTKIIAGGDNYIDDTNHLAGWSTNGTFTYKVEKNDIFPQFVFAECKFISVKISNSVTSVEGDSFGYCSGLTSVMIPNSVTSIGERAFGNCSGLTSVTIPNSVTSIGSYAFRNCSGLTSITIPNSVMSIGNAVFSGCGSLSSVVVESGNTRYDSRNGCNAIIDKYTNTLIAGCKTTTITNSVKSIGDYAFEHCRALTSITIPNTVATIGECAFSNCSGLTTITIPNSVKSIGDYAFENCRALTSVSVSNSVTYIGNGAFFTCYGLTSITIPNSVTSIGSRAFVDCRSLTSITIPNSVTTIGDYAFSGCSGLTSIKVESGNTIYDSRNNCNAIIRKSDNILIVGCKNTVIPNSVTSIGKSAFYYCNGLTSIIIPNSVTSIGGSAFKGCSGLISISIPNSVTSIGSSAFSYCSGLTSISIPNSVTSIGSSAFSYCNGLKDVVSEIKTPFKINENVFSVYSTATLTVPSGTKSAYQSTNYWNKFTNIVEQETETIIQGDVNGDQEVNVSDIVEVVNYINNNASAIFLKNNADLNGDGEVNVTDIVWMVNIIMSGQSGAARKTSNRAGVLTDGDCLTIEDLTMNAGETKQVSVLLNNPDKKYTAFQFDLTLPDGVTIVRNSNGKLMASLVTDRIDDHTLSVAEMGDNIYRLLAFSMSNAEFYGTGGALVNITLQADENISNGAKAAMLRSQVFTATNGVQFKWADKEFGILVNDSENTGIDEILQNSQKGSLVKVYTLTGLLMFTVPQSGFAEKWQDIPSGVYIVNGQKMIKSDDTK